MTVCCPDGKEVHGPSSKFWLILTHYVSPKSSKMWRANAESLLAQLCPEDFDMQKIQGHRLCLLELSYALRSRSPSCETYTKLQVANFVASYLTGTDAPERDVTFTLMALKILSTLKVDIIPQEDLFQFCSKCYSLSDMFKAISVAAWNNIATNIDLGTLIDIADDEGLELVVRTLPEKIGTWCKITNKLVVTSFRLDCPDLIHYSLRNIPQSIELSTSSITSTWLMLQALTVYTENLTEDHLRIASSLLMFYLTADLNLTPEIEHLREFLTGRILEIMVTPCIDILKHAISSAVVKNCLNLLLASDCWQWIQNRPKIFEKLIPLLIIHMSQENAIKYSEVFGCRRIWWTLLQPSIGQESRQALYRIALNHQQEAATFIWSCICCHEARGFDQLDRTVLRDFICNEQPTDISGLEVIKEWILTEPCLELASHYSATGIRLPENIMERLFAHIQSNMDSVVIRNQAIRWLECMSDSPDAILQTLRSFEEPEEVFIEARFRTLIEPLEHDHSRVVGYDSCCAECYCD